MSGSFIAVALTDEQIRDCFPVMAGLRPHIRSEEFLPLVRRLEGTCGFRLAFLFDAGVKAVAGYRVSEWLAGGKYLEIEDLAAKEGERSRGYGGRLFDWLVQHGRDEGCDHLRLVSRVTRADAHRFYLRKGMTHEAHYFSMPLREGSGK